MNLKKISLFILIILVFFITYYISYSYNINDLNKNFLFLITNKFSKQEINIDIFNLYLNKMKSNTNNYFNIETTLVMEEVNNYPTIYIYNTHSNEEYSYLKNDIYNIIPTVQTASYILEDELNKLGINSLVESENVTDLVNKNNLLYKDSYKVSRTLLENKKNEYKTLEYFIDLHRDSVSYEYTTTVINGESYAKVLFVLGLENENYSKNKEVITEINDYINLNYKGLSRGIYEKQGNLVNGVYNQDFNTNTMLIEIGGIDNNITEVSNTIKVIANSLYNYISSHNKTN